MPIADSQSASEESLDTELTSHLAAALSGITVPVSLQANLPEQDKGSARDAGIVRRGRKDKVLYVTFRGENLVLVEPEAQPARGKGSVKDPEAALSAIVRVIKATLRDSRAGKFTPVELHIASIVARSLPEARRNASEATIEKMVDALIETQDPVAQVRAEIDAGNAKARMRFMNNFMTLTAEEVADNAGSRARNRHQAASRWKKEGKIFSISWQGLDRYPAFQFKEGRPLPAIAAVLANLPKRMSSWETAFWFVSTNGWLGGKAPRELLDSPERLADAARHESEAVVG